MQAVLGVDAAWTDHNPSGVALIVERSGRWELTALAASYGEFLALAPDGATQSVGADGRPDAAALVSAAETLAGTTVALVAVDMPLGRTPIRRRRPADDAVSRAYGTRKCGTHSPSVDRPGLLSDLLSAEFATAGYSLCTEAIVTPGLIEVYPHPALVELARGTERLPYKAAKTRTYWKNMGLSERRFRLLAQWAEIITLLEGEVGGVASAMPLPAPGASGRALKAYEDRIDALVCAWVAAEALAGRARPYGDADAAIWIPEPRIKGIAD